MKRPINPKRWTVAHVRDFLLHAFQHCMWGSDNTIRDASPADLEAAKIFEQLRKES